MLSGIKRGKKKKADTPSAAEPDSLPSFDNAGVASQLRQSMLVQPDSQPVSLSVKGSFCSPLIQTKYRPEKVEEDMTVKELVAMERQDAPSLDEQMLRNLSRSRKRQRQSGRESSDDEVEQMKRLLPVSLVNGKDSISKNAKNEMREGHRLVAQNRNQNKVTSRCSWWVESSSFRDYRLLATGKHCSLVMAPPQKSLLLGHHFYLVPLKHATSFVNGGIEDEHLWQDVEKFQSALNNLYACEGKGVIMFETILPNKQGLWQTKLEVVPVPFTSLKDSPIYFSSAMKEQVEDWGTHNKIIELTKERPAKRSLPKGFPYFLVFWGNVSTSESTGFAQIIESSAFPMDFGVETIASILAIDSPRLRGGCIQSTENEQLNIVEFKRKWEKFDFTRGKE